MIFPGLILSGLFLVLVSTNLSLTINFQNS